MNENLRCSNTDNHVSHFFEADVQYHCSGTVECGMIDHEPHMFTLENVSVRCPGRCNCSFIQGVHSPGDHK